MNIEIIGFSDGQTLRRQMVARIDRLYRKKKLASLPYVIITVYQADARDTASHTKPFIRVNATDKKEFDAARRVFLSMTEPLDIEYNLLHGFEHSDGAISPD